MKAPLSGGAATVLATGSEAGYLAIDSASVYWTVNDGSVMKCALGGGTATTLAPPAGRFYARGIAVDSSNVYWAAPAVIRIIDGQIRSVPVGGGTLAVLVEDQTSPTAVIVDPTGLCWAQTAGTPAVMSVPLTGGPASQLVSTEVAPTGLAADSTNVYWTVGSAGMVLEAPLSGGTPTTLASDQSAPAGLTVDGQNVYWANAGDGTIMRAPIGGGTPTTVASGQASPGGITFDATSLYWTNDVASVGSVMKLVPK